jgi:hypothetical protein
VRMERLLGCLSTPLPRPGGPPTRRVLLQ